MTADGNSSTLEQDLHSALPLYTLSLHTDRIAPKAEGRLPGCNRVIYVREGDAIVRAGAQAAGLAANSAWHGRDPVTLIAGAAGATLLRWELCAGGDSPASDCWQGRDFNAYSCP